jgi:hypothetical protein
MVKLSENGLAELDQLDLRLKRPRSRARSTGKRKRASSPLRQPGSSLDPFQPAAWFGKKLAARIRQAASKNRPTKRVRKRRVLGVVVYSVNDARRWWERDCPK